MTYKFELDILTNLDAPTVEQIIFNVVQERTGRQIKEIVTKVTDGRFDGFQIHFAKEIAEVKKDKMLEKVFKWD